MTACRTQPQARKRAPSASYLRFESVIKRSLVLLELHPKVEDLFSRTSKPIDVSDMTRAAVVLAVAAMDAYFTGVFAERLVPYIKKKKTATPMLTELLERAGLNANLALELLAMERPYRRIRKLMDSYLAQHVTQRVEVIDELFMAYGIKSFCSNVQAYAKRKTLLPSISNLVKRRHEIVHKGDVNSHGRLQQITPSRIKASVLNVVKFVSSADEILQKQLAG